jgi:DNA repair protein RadC
MHDTLSRLVELGPGSLSDVEIVVLLIKKGATPTAEEFEQAAAMLEATGSILGLVRMEMRELLALPGVSRRSAILLKVGLEVGRRLVTPKNSDNRYQVKSPADAASLLMIEMSQLDQEHLRVVLLDTKNRVQRVTTVYVGSVNSAMVRVGEIFKEANRQNSAAIIVAHNHPSGDPTPSPEDVLVTRQVVEAGKLLDIEVLDHLVIGQGRYVSMRERGLGFG